MRQWLIRLRHERGGGERWEGAPTAAPPLTGTNFRHNLFYKKPLDLGDDAESSACSPGVPAVSVPRAAECSALGPGNSSRKGTERLKEKLLTVTITGDCCTQGNPNRPKHPEMLGEGLPVKTATSLKWQVRMPFSQGMAS